MIEIKDIEKLAELSRIRVSDEEKETFLEDIKSILGYVDQIKMVVGNGQTPLSEIGLKNVFREDSNPHNPNKFTANLLDSAPEKENGYVKVKKIL